METSWVNNWDGVCIALCLHSKRGTQPFNTAASITPHQENDVPLDPINKNNTLCVCVCRRNFELNLATPLMRQRTNIC